VAVSCFVLANSPSLKAEEKIAADSSKQATNETSKVTKDGDKQTEKHEVTTDHKIEGTKDEKKNEKDSEKSDEKVVETPADRVVVMYFHRTQRCPTCRRMGSYTEEAVKEKFAEDLKKGTVELHFIDFQDRKNEALTKGYKVSGPTLIVAKIEENKVKDFKNLTDIWAKNGDKQEFFEYVQESVSAYAKKPDAEKK
jgi:thiol-disulfide isomerase/thioredoxin